MTKLDHNFLATILTYNPETGVLTWLWRGESMFSSVRVQRLWNTRYAGRSAGYVDKSTGYVRLSMPDGRREYAHRAVWTLMTGDAPPEEIDHDNGVRCDNRWVNLVASTKQQNVKNKSMTTRNRSGVQGVAIDKRGRFIACGSENNRTVYLGSFADLPAAAGARKAYEEANCYNPNHGRPHRDKTG